MFSGICREYTPTATMRPPGTEGATSPGTPPQSLSIVRWPGGYALRQRETRLYPGKGIPTRRPGSLHLIMVVFSQLYALRFRIVMNLLFSRKVVAGKEIGKH